tara:strand:+ start:302 stop:541 length:240 start_codon:yes stop_codon:yes gene_type:complete
MSSVFRAKTFIAPATALDNDGTDSRGRLGMANLVQNYLSANDVGGSETDIDEVLSVSSCKLSGDKVFTIVVIEDDIGTG